MMRRLLCQEHGIAVPIVVMIIAIISLLGFTAAFLVESQATMGRRSSDSERAIYFAEAGLNKYLWHLNKDSKYYEVPEVDKTADDARLNVDTPFQDGFYRLQVDPPTTEEPVVTIRSTGWPASDPTNRRSVEITVRKRQFVQTIYLSGEETMSSGQTVWWITGDEVFGPLHTNGTLHIDGDPIFHGPVTYSVNLDVRAGSNPFYEEGPPQKVAPLTFPPSNSQLKTQAQYNGYYYNGRTCILLNGNQVTIRNGTGSAVTRPLPPNGVIYVDGTSNPDESRTDKWNLSRGNVFVAGTLDGRLTIAAANNIYITHKNPTNFNYLTAGSTGGLCYANDDFDPNGGITDDMLGLVANGRIRLLHYYWPTSTWPYYDVLAGLAGDVSPQNVTIHGALFALNPSWEYEEWDEGPARGTITLVGSITQQFRGAVGTFFSLTGTRLTGYNKNYRHDPRMAYDTPPHFLQPVNAGWEIVSWKEIANP